MAESVEITPKVLEEIRPSTITYHVAKRLIETRFRDAGEDLPVSLFGDAQRIVRRWIDEGYLVAKGVPLAAVTYLQLADEAAERIYLASQRVTGSDRRVKAILDPYNQNQGLNFEVPYRDGATARRYFPDFIVRIDDAATSR